MIIQNSNSFDDVIKHDIPKFKDHAYSVNNHIMIIDMIQGTEETQRLKHIALHAVISPYPLLLEQAYIILLHCTILLLTVLSHRYALSV